MLKFKPNLRPTLLLSLLLPCLLPSYSVTANITSSAHHRRYSGTNAGLTHRSLYFPKIDHRLRDSTRRIHLFSDTNSEATRTDISENRHTDNGSERFTPNPRFSLASLFQSPPAQAPLRRSSIHHQGNLTPNSSKAREITESFNQFPEFDTSTAPPAETVTSSGELSKLDAMLDRLESANEELIVELQHERDELVTRKKRKHHEPARQSRRHHRDRHDNEQVRVGIDQTHHTTRRPRYHQRASTTDAVNSFGTSNFINNNDPFNLAGRRDGSYRHDNKYDYDRLEYRHPFRKSDRESLATRQQSLSIAENRDHESQITRGESPDAVVAAPSLRQTRRRTPKGGGASRVGDTRRSQNNYNNQYPVLNPDFTSGANHFLNRIRDTDKQNLYQNVNTNSESEILRGGQGIGSVFGAEYESVGTRLDDGARDGEEMVADDVEATVVEEADYQDEDARVRGRGGRGGSVQQQHHIRERDAQSLRLASENVRYVMTNAQCSLPVRRCIDLSVNQTIIGKKYWPRCAIVSRCGEESGCCYSPQHVCSVAETHVIDLYFFYMTFEANSRAGVDRLTFENHTKCECRPRPAGPPLLPRNAPPLPLRNAPSPTPQATPSATLSNDEPVVLTSSRNHNSDSKNTYHASPLRQQRHNNNNNYENNIGGQEATKSSGHHSHQRRLQQQQDRIGSGGSGQNRVSSRETSIKGQDDRDASLNSVGDRDTSVKSLDGRGAFTKSSTDKDNSVKISANTEPIVTSVAATEDNDNAAISSTNVHSCKCPEVYRPSATPSVAGTCECVCNIDQGNCRRLMKGKRYFKAKDEKCILSGECGVPACQFGPFLNEYRRCPRKREMKNGRAITSGDI